MHPDQQDHWTQVYTQKAPSEVSWFQAEPEATLRALERLHVPSSSAFVDVGGGASNLVDALLQRGWDDMTVIDIAGSALAAAKQRLGEKAARVQWEVADITEWQPPRRYDVWHDRAVFHFLTEPDQRAAYRRTLLKAIAPAGLVIMATFALDGRRNAAACQCSDTMRQASLPRSAAALHRSRTGGRNTSPRGGRASPSPGASFAGTRIKRFGAPWNGDSAGVPVAAGSDAASARQEWLEPAR